MAGHRKPQRGFCTTCYRSKVDKSRSKSSCSRCLDARNKRRNRLRSSGVCRFASCGKPLFDKTYCMTHHSEVIARQKERRTHRHEEGICTNCLGFNATNLRYQWCFKCRKYRADIKALSRVASDKPRYPARVSLSCSYCGKVFDRCPSHVRQPRRIFCSMRCKKESGWTTRICGGCGRQFVIYAHMPSNFCSHICAVTSVRTIAKATRTRNYPHSTVEDVEAYLTMKKATRKVEQCLTQTK